MPGSMTPINKAVFSGISVIIMGIDIAIEDCILMTLMNYISLHLKMLQTELKIVELLFLDLIISQISILTRILEKPSSDINPVIHLRYCIKHQQQILM